jgi:hypothetical protein
MAFITERYDRPPFGINKCGSHGRMMEFAQASPAAVRTEPVVEIATDFGKVLGLNPKLRTQPVRRDVLAGRVVEIGADCAATGRAPIAKLL